MNDQFLVFHKTGRLARCLCSEERIEGLGWVVVRTYVLRHVISELLAQLSDETQSLSYGMARGRGQGQEVNHEALS